MSDLWRAARDTPADVTRSVTCAANLVNRPTCSLANELSMRPRQAYCHRGLGTLYCQTGQVEQACAALSTAIEIYRDMEMTFGLPETEATLEAMEAAIPGAP